MNEPLGKILLEWYSEHGRTLPWRNTNNPYIIWVSEVILQQTQVKQGYDYFLRFVKRFPDVDSLASASEDEVLNYWQGLGYYSRARNLHAAAKQIVDNGGFPKDYKSIRALKGVGDYTAAAIASFAYGLPHAVVDGNVYRVLARYFGISEPIDTGKGKKMFAELAQNLLPVGKVEAYNQAIMDFGATVCTPQRPSCKECPLASTCLAFNTGTVKSLPCKSKKMAVTTRRMVYIFIMVNGETALFRRNGRDIWNGLYEPYLVYDETGIKQEKRMKSASQASDSYTKVIGVLEQTGILGNDDLSVLATGIRHQLTHRTLICDFYLLRLSQKPDCSLFLRQPTWVSLSESDNYAMPQLIVNVIEKAKFF